MCIRDRPSIMLVVMGPIMEIPVIDLFAAAILPGILLASLYAAYTTIRCRINGKVILSISIDAI